MFGIKEKKLPVDLKYDEPISTIQDVTDLREGFKSTGINTEPRAITSDGFVSGSTGWRFTSQGDLEANSGKFRGSLEANSIDIPDKVTANSFHTDNTGNSWWGSININSGKAIIDSTGKITATDIKIGNRFLVVAPGDDIQTAIDTISLTGGRIILQNGTHSLSADLTLYSNVYLQGENAGSTILDFQTNAYGIKIVGTNPYTTGTISIPNGDVTVTGVGTTWTSGMLGQNIMLGGGWYPITAVGSTTSLTIAIPFAGATLPAGTTYTIATTKNDIKITDLTIKNASSGMKAQYTSEFFIKDVEVQTSVIGIEFVDTAQTNLDQIDVTASNTGYSFSNSHFWVINGSGSVDAQASHGLILNNCTNYSINGSFFLNSVGDGINATDCDNGSITATTCAENGGQGIEFVAGAQNISLISNSCSGNTSDGIKLTGTTDNLQIIGNSIKNNGGYGINIAASDCDGNNITGDNFAGNTSGAVNDGGTGTLIRGNVGVDDNSTGNLASAQFGGDGSDGSLSITSGVTTIDLLSASYLVMNYTSISITGTASLVFANPHPNGTIIILKSQGDVTLTSSNTPMIDASEMGANATDGFGINIPKTAKGSVGSNVAGGVGGAGGVGNGSISEVISVSFQGKSLRISTGGGGGKGGDQDDGTGGVGGAGGAGLLIECAGDLNFTTTDGISVAGGAGGAGGAGSVNGGGGGGAGGVGCILYKTATAKSGTITVAGGAGGDGDGGTSGGAGGDGSSGDSTGGTGGTGNATNGRGGGGGGASDVGFSNGQNGQNGISAGNGGGGGGGASGIAIITENKFFV